MSMTHKNIKQTHFLTGAATSSHQVEGGNKNDWSEWEFANAQRLSIASGSAYGADNYISGRAADHYNRYEEDFDIAKSLGHNAHRFSIEWSRIEPKRGEYDDAEISHYKDVVRALHDHGLEPVVTLYHWTVPLWFRDQGGWLNAEAPEQFAEFAARVSVALPSVKYWCTINEPEVYTAHSFIKGVWPPMTRSVWSGIIVMRRLARAHRVAYTAIHANIAKAKVGFAVNMTDFVPRNILFWPFAALADAVWNRWWITLTNRNYDWVGVNYYFSKQIGWGRQEAPISVSDMGWPSYPDGLYRILLSCKRYRAPVLVTENGIADAHDEHREEYIHSHMHSVKRAKNEGVPVIGYLHWSLLDNFEWDKGFWPKFGLVAVDRNTMERHVRKSARTIANARKSKVFKKKKVG